MWQRRKFCLLWEYGVSTVPRLPWRVARSLLFVSLGWTWLERDGSPQLLDRDRYVAVLWEWRVARPETAIACSPCLVLCVWTEMDYLPWNVKVPRPGVPFIVAVRCVARPETVMARSFLFVF